MSWASVIWSLGVGVLCLAGMWVGHVVVRAPDRRNGDAQTKLADVQLLVDQARKISPSGSMSIYVADVERALGLDVARPHKLGDNE